MFDHFASILFVLILGNFPEAFDFLLLFGSLCLKSPVLSTMLQIYYLARGRQFVSAYALSMVLVVEHILLIVNSSHLLHISVNLGKLYLSL